MLLEEFPHLRKQFWGLHLWARGYFAVTTGTITDAMVKEYIAEQEGGPFQDDSRFRRPSGGPPAPRVASTGRSGISGPTGSS